MDDEQRQDLVSGANHYELRPSAQLYHSYTAYRAASTRNVRTVTVGRYVAFHTKQTDVLEEQKGHCFSLGRVTNIKEDNLVVHYYHTSVKPQTE